MFKTLMTHRNETNLHVPLTSAYRSYHSTETASKDPQRALNQDECVSLVLLDFSAAFGAVDHGNLKHHLEQEFGVTDGALQWINSHLQNRRQAVLVRGVESGEKPLCIRRSTGICPPASIIPGLYHSTCQPI